MAKTLVGALALAALPSALAFRNTSPFFLFSTADINVQDTDGPIAEASTVTSQVLQALKGCPTRNYIIVHQEGVSSADFVDGRSTPQLSHYMSGKDEGVSSTLAIPEVIGQVDVQAIVTQLESNCAGDKRGTWLSNRVSQVPSVSTSRRVNHLRDDAWLGQEIVHQANSEDYTVIYVTTPQTELQAKAQLQQGQYTYEMDDTFPDAVQMELKRDLLSHAKRANSTQGGLFERYQYFTPGLFMGLSAIIPLFLILLVGIRALTSLEVSYFAFSKEMGPNAQKKQ